jgi:hypothetical protein
MTADETKLMAKWRARDSRYALRRSVLSGGEIAALREWRMAEAREIGSSFMALVASRHYPLTFAELK